MDGQSVGGKMKTSETRERRGTRGGNASGSGSDDLGAGASPSPTLAVRSSDRRKRRGSVVVDQERCKACELCIAVCPEGALELLSVLNSFGYHPVSMKQENSCTGCALCAQVCPDVALEVYRE
jgi:2-oxoglutarate ferredoxin oxidoreductase subunit delta